MVNKILKIFFLFSLILVSTYALESQAAEEVRVEKINKMLINVTNLNEEDGIGYPKLLTKSSVVSQDYNLVKLTAVSQNTAYLEVANPMPSGYKTKDGAIILLLSDTSEYYGYTIYVEPKYQAYSSGNSTSGYPKYTWYYPDNKQGDKFDARYIGAKITINIYALKEQKSGTISIPQQTIANLHVTTIRSNGITPLESTSEIIIGSFNVTPSFNTCKIISSDVHTISMKPVEIKNFPSIGSEVDGEDETTIVLNCSKEATSVKVGMTDITERNNTSNQLKLDPKSTALGFAVTLYRDNGNIITYNPDPKTGNNTWELSPSTSYSDGVNYNVPIKAKYYRTGRIISPGIVLANAMITFIYE